MYDESSNCDKDIPRSTINNTNNKKNYNDSEHQKSINKYEKL